MNKIDAMDIVEFLEARLAEDEAWARNVESRRDQEVKNGRGVKHQPPVDRNKPDRAPWAIPGEPAVVQSEVAAKRAIIATLKEGDLRLFPGLWKAIELLAVPYSDHPDYEKVEAIFPDLATDKTRLM